MARPDKTNRASRREMVLLVMLAWLLILLFELVGVVAMKLMAANPLLGERELRDAEVHLLGEIKQHGIAVSVLIDHLYNSPGLDMRWLGIGRTHMQEGLMALMRAVARPPGF